MADNRCPCGSYARKRDCPKCKTVLMPSAIEVDRQLTKATNVASAATTKYKQAIRQIEALEQSLGIMDALKAADAIEKISPKFSKGTSEATAGLILSDWHSEEGVPAESVNYVNEFNLEIADTRITRCWRSGERLIRLLKQDVKIPTILIGLLGDFITGQIHGAENAESNNLLPMDAIVWVQQRITAGLNFMLESQPDSEFVVVCKAGNHGRTTPKTRMNGAEMGHSLEYLMYLNLAQEFRNEKRIRFTIERSYYTYLPIYDQVLRIHHGHNLKYGGGRGGLFTPTYTAIDDANKTKRATLDVFGHFHQMRDGGNFICNGSLIGYNAFAQWIKAHFEPPKQTLFLLDKKRGRTCTWPILLERA